jgi:hypothetical protein
MSARCKQHMAILAAIFSHWMHYGPAFMPLAAAWQHLHCSVIHWCTAQMG